MGPPPARLIGPACGPGSWARLCGRGSVPGGGRRCPPGPCCRGAGRSIPKCEALAGCLAPGPQCPCCPGPGRRAAGREGGWGGRPWPAVRRLAGAGRRTWLPAPARPPTQGPRREVAGPGGGSGGRGARRACTGVTALLDLRRGPRLLGLLRRAGRARGCAALAVAAALRLVAVAGRCLSAGCFTLFRLSSLVLN